MIMKFEEFGTSESGAPTVIMSAGLGGLGRFWEPQLGALTKDFRVITYDHRGTGRNAGLLEVPYSIENMADDVEQIIHATSTTSYHFIGHALGGLVGLALARRPQNRCKSLCLMNAWASLDTHTARCFNMRLALLEHVGPEAYVNAQPIFLYPAAWLSANASFAENEVAHGIAGFQGSRNLVTRIDALRAFDASADIPHIKVPTLVTASRDDVLVPFTKSEALADGLTAARLWLAPEGGHSFSVTSPASFNRVMVNFLKDVGRE